jgi:hypothetical protein
MQPKRLLLWGAVVFALASLVPPTGVGEGSSTEIRDVDGRPLKPFEPTGPANVIFFIATDCPISNGYAPEIQHIAHVRGCGYRAGRNSAR